MLKNEKKQITKMKSEQYFIKTKKETPKHRLYKVLKKFKKINLCFLDN